MEIIPTEYIPGKSGKFATVLLVDDVISFAEYPGQVFDLAELLTDATKCLRFSVDRNGNISLDAHFDYWLIAELVLPARTYTSEPALDKAGKPVLDENGSPETISVAKSVLGDDVELTAWQLPPEKKLKKALSP